MNASRLDRPELATLWTAARRRFEATDGPVARIRLTGLGPDERVALADLLGLAHTPGPEATVVLRELDARLRTAVGLDTRAVVEAIGGPLTDRAGARRQRATERAELWRWAGEHPTVVAEPALLTWLDRVRAGGLAAGDLAGNRRLLEQAFAVLAALPAAGEPLAVLAARCTGDSHALDGDCRLGRLVLRALATLRDEEPPAGAEQRRRLWERFGVACDELSTGVLVAGLRPAGPGPLGQTLRLWADAGQATLVTLAQLRHDPVGELSGRGPHGGDAAPGHVFVVENPSVMAVALRRFGAACPPLVCTSGWPSTAAIMLLRALAASGARLRYHGDVDGDGLRIAAYVMTRVNATPWRLGVGDYRQAVPVTGPPVGRIDDTPWDPELAPAVRAHGVALLEEVVTESLLADLAQHTGPPALAGRPVPA